MYDLKGPADMPMNAKQVRPTLVSGLMETDKKISVLEEEFSTLGNKLTSVMAPTDTPTGTATKSQPLSPHRLMDIVKSHNVRLEAVIEAIRQTAKNLDL